MKVKAEDCERPATNYSPVATTLRRWPGAGTPLSYCSSCCRFGQAVSAAPQVEGRGRDLSLALANRSAALLRLGFPQLALEDVAEAVKAGYPIELRYKVGSGAGH